MKKKIVSICLVAALIAIAIAGGTIAYFTDTPNEVKNTFTVGKVDIELTETSEKGDGIVAGEANSANGFDYSKMVPGVTYAKKPVITVDKDSLNAYVFAELIISNYDKLQAILEVADEEDGVTIDESKLDEAFLVGAAEGLGSGTLVGYWLDGTNYHLVYGFDVKQANDAITLFTGVQIPAKFDKCLNGVTDSIDLSIKAYAIQADGIADQEAAFDEFFNGQTYQG